jgi:hypothetical protein
LGTNVKGNENPAIVHPPPAARSQFSAPAPAQFEVAMILPLQDLSVVKFYHRVIYMASLPANGFQRSAGWVPA